MNPKPTPICKSPTGMQLIRASLRHHDQKRYVYFLNDHNSFQKIMSDNTTATYTRRAMAAKQQQNLL
jgi:hypothetical protein